MQYYQTPTGQSSFGTILQINLKLLWAACLLFISWWIWPDNMKWWGFGLIAIFMSAGAFGLLIDCLRMMVKLRMRDMAVKKYTAQGNKPNAAELASHEALQRSEMIDG